MPLLRSVGLAPPPPDGRLLSPPPPRRATGEGEGEETEEKTLLGLTEALLRADYGVADPTLLAEDFTFTGPVLGPLTKDEYLQAFGGASARGPSYFESLRAAMPDLDYRYRDARQCAFDERRVWFTSSPSGTHTGETLRFDKRGLGLGFGFGFGFDGKEGAEVVVPAKGKKWHAPPECCSAQFDEEGRCVALTGGYVMDRRLGNTGGFGGVAGLCVALDAGSQCPVPRWLLRTPVQNGARLKEALSEALKSDNPELLDLFEEVESYENLGKTGQKI